MLSRPLTLADLRDRSDEIRGVLDRLAAQHRGSLYFPFFFWRGTELRPMQPYLNKLPAEFVSLFPELGAAADAASASRTEATRRRDGSLGATYRPALVGPSLERDPFSVDPALVERGLKGHADTQNALAQALRDAGTEPRSRLAHEPNFDLAWEAGGTVFVAEIKSITDRNEEGQLRLGLGQVLRNKQRLELLGHENVVAVLVPERSPNDPSWHDLCDQVGVVLLGGDELSPSSVLAFTSRT
jgi:hypothetical protein